MLSVKMVKGDLVIRIPAKTLAVAADAAFNEAFGEPHKLVITDQTVFASEVVRMLEHEEEDGTTLVHKMLDQAMVAAAEDGCDGLEEKEEKEDDDD